jgi:hypothetical protein
MAANRYRRRVEPHKSVNEGCQSVIMRRTLAFWLLPFALDLPIFRRLPG